MTRRAITLVVLALLLVPGCMGTKAPLRTNSHVPEHLQDGSSAVEIPTETRWDVYYSRLKNSPVEIVVVEPLGTSRPMGKLLAVSVASELEQRGISASTAATVPAGDGGHMVLSGTAETNSANPRIRYAVLIHWILSDARGNAITTHAQGVEGSIDDWNMGSPALIVAVGKGIAGPIAHMVMSEYAPPPPPAADPTTKGIMLGTIGGVTPAEEGALKKHLSAELLARDIFLTGDERQARYSLSAVVEVTPSGPGQEKARISWKVSELDGTELGSALQEREVPAGSLTGRWAEVAPRVAPAAAGAISRILTDFSRAPARPSVMDGPPDVPLPAIPGRAPPPPR